MQKNICFFTGHRKIPTNLSDSIAAQLQSAVLSVINKGVTHFMSGGALGFDTMSAYHIIHLKHQFSQLNLEFILPCPDQNKYWSQRQTDHYYNMLSNADNIIYTSDYYYPGCMQKRNRYLVDHSQFCICYQTKDTGGTAYTTNYARKKGTPIINIASDALHSP